MQTPEILDLSNQTIYTNNKIGTQMPRIHRGCRGLATARKELIVSKLIQKELGPFMEIIERHHTRCREKCCDIRDLCTKYRVTDNFSGRSSIPGIQIMSGLLNLAEVHIDLVMTVLMQFVISKIEHLVQESTNLKAEDNKIMKHIENSPNSVLRSRFERILVEYRHNSQNEKRQQEHDLKIWNSESTVFYKIKSNVQQSQLG